MGTTSYVVVYKSKKGYLKTANCGIAKIATAPLQGKPLTLKTTEKMPVLTSGHFPVTTNSIWQRRNAVKTDSRRVSPQRLRREAF
jgi:hypothetical protein